MTQAVEKLGLTLELSKTPQQVLVVESVNEQPSANPPGVTAALPPLPPPEFEVASIRPCDAAAGGGSSIRPEPGGRLTMNCMPLLTVLNRALGANPQSQQVAGAPKWLAADSRSDNLSPVAKAPEGTVPDGVTAAQTQEIYNAMLRALLVERYKLAFHYEDLPMDAYTLVAAKPKLIKADPSNRTGCTRVTGATPGLACKNMTMAQFAEQIPGYETSILYQVLDGTGLEGAFDFTINYNALGNLAAELAQVAAAARARAGVDPAAPAAEPAEPSGSVSFADAIEKQLGLKLERHKRPEPVLLIDHIEEKPTDN